MSSFVDRNKGDVSSGCTITTNGSDRTYDSPSRSYPPGKGRGLSVLLMENAREPLNPSRLTQSITSGVYKSVNQRTEAPGMSLLLPVSPAYTKSLIPSSTKSVRRPAE